MATGAVMTFGPAQADEVVADDGGTSRRSSRTTSRAPSALRRRSGRAAPPQAGVKATRSAPAHRAEYVVSGPGDELGLDDSRPARRPDRPPPPWSGAATRRRSRRGTWWPPPGGAAVGGERQGSDVGGQFGRVRTAGEAISARSTCRSCRPSGPPLRYAAVPSAERVPPVASPCHSRRGSPSSAEEQDPGLVVDGGVGGDLLDDDGQDLAGAGPLRAAGDVGQWRRTARRWGRGTAPRPRPGRRWTGWPHRGCGTTPRSGRRRPRPAAWPPGRSRCRDTLPAPSPKATIRPWPSRTPSARGRGWCRPARPVGARRWAEAGAGRPGSARRGRPAMHRLEVQRSPSRSRRSPARSPTGVSSPQLAPLDDDQTSMVPEGMSPFTACSTEKRYRTRVSLESGPRRLGSSRAMSRPTNAPSTSGSRSRTSYVMQEHAEACGGDGRTRAAAARTRTRRTRRMSIRRMVRSAGSRPVHFSPGAGPFASDCPECGRSSSG